MEVRTKSFRFALLTGLSVASFASVFGCEVSFQRACEDDEECLGEVGGDNSPAPSGGRSSGQPDGGNGGQGGDPGSGGLGGASEGIGGDGPVSGSGGVPAVPTVPVLLQALVGGAEIEDGETVLGIEDGPELVFRFSEPMDKRSVQESYFSHNTSIDAEHVAFSWNKEADELRVIPLTPLKHAEVSDPEAETELFAVSLQDGARSRAGVEMKETFEASFRLMKRVTYFVIPDLRNSLWTTRDGGAGEEMISEEGLYPDHQGMNCPVFVSTTQPEEAGSLLLGYEVINNGIYPAAYQSYVSLDWYEPEDRSVGLYAFPLPQNVESIEEASLKVVKWYGLNNNLKEGVLGRADFSVDVLASDETGIQSWLEEPLVSDLTNTDGNDASFGYGPFEFDVTDVVADGVEREDKWTAYRLGFEEILEADQAVFACAAASLTIVYWAE